MRRASRPIDWPRSGPLHRCAVPRANGNVGPLACPATPLAGSIDDDAETVDDDAETVDDDAETVDDDAETVDDDAETVDDDAETVDDDAETVDDDAETVDDDAETVDDDAETVDDDAGTVDDGAETVDDDAETVDDDAETVDDDAETVEDDAVRRHGATQPPWACDPHRSSDWNGRQRFGHRLRQTHPQRSGQTAIPVLGDQPAAGVVVVHGGFGRTCLRNTVIAGNGPGSIANNGDRLRSEGGSVMGNSHGAMPR